MNYELNVYSISMGAAHLAVKIELNVYSNLG